MASLPQPKYWPKAYPQKETFASPLGNAISEAAAKAASGQSCGVLSWQAGFHDFGTAFAVAAIQAQMRGDDDFRALFFPWRKTTSLAGLARYLVDETLLVELAKKRINSRHGARANNPAADAYDLLTLRMNSIEKGASTVKGASRIPPDERHPVMAEMFPLFEPPSDPKGSYRSVNGSFMSRIRAYTDISSMLEIKEFENYASLVDDPALSPYAMFGMPSKSRREWQPAFDKIQGKPPRIAIIDLSENGIDAIGRRSWHETVSQFAEDVREKWPGIGILAIAESDKVMYDIANPYNKRPEIVSNFATIATSMTSMLTTSTLPPTHKSTVWKVMPKDESLTGIVHESKNLMRPLAQWGYPDARYAVDEMGERIIRLANYPSGWKALRNLVSTDGKTGMTEERFVNQFPSALNRPLKAALSDLQEKGETEKAARILKFMSSVSNHVKKMHDETPVYNRLRTDLGAIAKFLNDKTSLPIAVVFPGPVGKQLFHTGFLPSLPADERKKLAANITTFTASEYRNSLRSGAAERFRFAFMVLPEVDDVAAVISCPNPPPNTYVISDAQSAFTFANRLNVALAAIGGESWAEQVEHLSAELLKEIDNLPDFNALFESGERRIHEDRASTISIGGKNEIEFVSEDGVSIECGASAIVLIYDGGVGANFRRTRAKDVEPGDVIVIPSEDMSPTLMDNLRHLNRDEDNLHLELRRYHQDVLDRVAALPTYDDSYATSILHRMRARIKDIEDSEVHNIRRWIAVTPGQEKSQAPDDWERFSAFCEALKMSESQARDYWEGVILPWRMLRQSHGMDSYSRAIAFLEDPDSGSMHLRLGASFDIVMAEISQCMHTVADINPVMSPSMVMRR